jgi:hypothetical protein
MDTRGKPLVIEGITVEPVSIDRRAWVYVVRAPVLERGADGRPLLSVIEAGPMAFVQATARIALGDAARAALLEQLKAVEPAAETIDPAPMSVERVALEVRVGEAWVAVAEGRSSGMPPWTTALAATVSGEALLALGAAVGGDRGRARLTARVHFPGRPAEVRYRQSAGTSTLLSGGSASSTSFAVSADMSSPATGDRTLDIRGDIADGFHPQGSR